MKKHAIPFKKLKIDHDDLLKLPGNFEKTVIKKKRRKGKADSGINDQSSVFKGISPYFSNKKSKNDAIGPIKKE